MLQPSFQCSVPPATTEEASSASPRIPKPSITASALSSDTSRSASWERSQGRRRRSSQTLDAATGSLDSIRDEAQGRELGFVLSRIFRLVSTKARFLESYGGLCYHQPCIRSSIPDHDSLSELPFQLQGEAGRSINLSMDGGPPRKWPSYPACEPAAPGQLLRASSSTAAPPTCVRWPPWPPRCPGGTSTADSAAVIPDRMARPFGQLRSASRAASGCLAC